MRGFVNPEISLTKKRPTKRKRFKGNSAVKDLISNLESLLKIDIISAKSSKHCTHVSESSPILDCLNAALDNVESSRNC